MSAVLSPRVARILAVVLVVPALVLLLVVLGVLPVRAYATQRREISTSTDRLTLLTERNRDLRERIRLLRTDEEIKRIARDQYAMVPPGQKLLVIPGLGDGGRGLNTASGAAADRVPTAPVERSDTSFWQTLRDLARFASVG
jgi:cell division protein FtsB